MRRIQETLMYLAALFSPLAIGLVLIALLSGCDGWDIFSPKAISDQNQDQSQGPTPTPTATPRKPAGSGCSTSDECQDGLVCVNIAQVSRCDVPPTPTPTPSPR